MIPKLNLRWLFLAIPAYAAVYLGREGWPLVAALTAGTILYILTLEAASRRWPDWVDQHALFLRLAEIGIACIGLTLVYVSASETSVYESFYYDGFYAVFVILATIVGGRRGAMAAVALATGAVAYGQVIQAPDTRALWGPGSVEYWASVAAYSLIYGAFFAALAALARFGVEFQTRVARWNTLLRLGREVVHLHDAVLITDAAGTVSSVNPAAEKLFGPAGELWGSPLPVLFEGPLPWETREPIEVEARRVDGSTFEAEVSLSTYRSGDRAVAARVAVVRDLTARRAAERAAAQETRLASLERLAERLASELDGPTAAIAAVAESLLHDVRDDPLRQGLLRIAEEARRAAALVRDLLAFARSGGAKPVLLNVNEVVRRSLPAREARRPANVDLVEEFGHDLPKVLGVPAELELAVVKLLENAEEAVGAAGGGTIRVRTYASKKMDRRAAVTSTSPFSGDFVTVEISDSGAGIPPLVLERIFDPFFTTKGGEADGLGLSVVHGIVARHGGVVRASSRTGEGTSLIAEFPAAAEWAGVFGGQPGLVRAG